MRCNAGLEEGNEEAARPTCVGFSPVLLVGSYCRLSLYIGRLTPGLESFIS